MPELTVGEFRMLAMTDSATDTTDEKVGSWLNAAKDLIASKVGEDTWAEIAEADDESELKVRQFRLAQKKLAQREALNDASYRFRDGGIQKREVDINASATNEFEAYSETQRRKKDLYDEAFGAIEAFMTAAEVTDVRKPIPGFARVRVSSDW